MNSAESTATPLIDAPAPVSVQHAVRPSDLDALGHVNNAKVLEYLELGRLCWLRENGIDTGRVIVPVLARIEVDYLREILLSDVVIVTRLEQQTYYSVRFHQEISQHDGNAEPPSVRAIVTVNFIDMATRRPKRLREYLAANRLPLPGEALENGVAP